MIATASSNQPQIVYLFTNCQEERIHNDLRILQLLAEKEENARVNIGDVSVLLGTNDPDEQEERLADEIRQGTLEQEWETTLDTNAQAAEENEINYLEMILRQGSGGEHQPDTRPFPGQRQHHLPLLLRLRNRSPQGSPGAVGHDGADP